MPQEVTEASHEALHVLELHRTPRPEKLAAERAFFDGAHEVRFTERTFRPKHGADLEEIRAFVDSLEVRRRETPPVELPPAPAAAAVPPKIPPHHREPLERAIRGSLLSVETVHRIGAGTVVDVQWEAEDEGERRGLYVIEDGEARPYEAVASKVDELPPPRLEAPPVEEAPVERAPEPAPPEPKKGLFGRSKSAAEPAPEKEKKGLFGRKKKEEPAAPAEPAPEAEPPAEKKRRFGFRRK